MPVSTSAVKVNPLTGALIDPIAATFASANGFLTSGTSDAKDSVVCATTANGTLATAFENGDTVDGIVLATGNRILIKNQSAPAENGIYTVNASGAPTRATDFDVWTEIVGAFVTVESGTVNAGTQWLCNVVSGGTLNTTAITFVVPKNFVDLTTAQSIGGLKVFTDTVEATYFQAGSIGSGSLLELAPTSLTIFSNTYASALVGPGVGMSGSWLWTLPDASGTLATTTGNVATATALATPRNIFNISFDGTANVDGDAVNTGHFASIPSTGAAGHFVTKNGTAPTLIAGRSAWYSDGSGVPSFKNGTGTAVTLVRSSDIGVSVQAYDADLTTWAGITPGTGVGTGILSRPVFATTATAAGTTTLTVASASTQEFTGSTTQTVTMPVVTTLVDGWATLFINKSTGNVTLQSSGSNAIVVLARGQSVTLVCKSVSVDTTAAAWDAVGQVLFFVENSAAQTVTNSTTFVDATGLSVSLLPGTWEVNWFAAFYNDAAAGCKLKWITDANVKIAIHDIVGAVNSTPITNYQVSDSIATGFRQVAASSGVFRHSGIIVTSSTTTFKLQIANFAASGNTVLDDNSYILARRLY